MNLPSKRIKIPTAIALLTAAGLAMITAQAQQSTLDAPFGASDSAYYIQVNFAAMRDTENGRRLLEWVDDEIFEEIADELGADVRDDLAQNFDGISIFGTGPDQDPVILTHGYLTESMHDLMRGHLDSADADDVTRATRHGQDYYTFAGGDIDLDFLDIDTDSGDTVYFSIGNLGQGMSMMTTNEAIFDEFLANGATWNSTMTNDLIVIQANRALVQGGLNTDHDVFEHGPWESKFFQNVEQVGLAITDAGDGFNVRAEAVSRTPEMAEALGNIARGLLSFKAMADIDDEDLGWLNNLQVSTDSSSTVFELQIPVDHLLDAID